MYFVMKASSGFRKDTAWSDNTKETVQRRIKIFLRVLHHTHTGNCYDLYQGAYDQASRYFALSDNKGIFHTYSGSSKDNLIFFLFALDLALGFDVAELSLVRDSSSKTSSSWMTLAFLRFF